MTSEDGISCLCRIEMLSRLRPVQMCVPKTFVGLQPITAAVLKGQHLDKLFAQL
jgi:hypothetical protein